MWNHVERAFCIFAIIYFSGAFIPLYWRQGNGAALRADAGLPLLLLRIAIYLVLLFFVFMRFHRSARLSLPPFWLSALLVWIVASALWSSDPQETIQKSGVLLFSSLFGMYLAHRFTLRDQVKLFATALGILAILSVPFSLFVPFLGTMKDAEGITAWNGVFAHKNEFGKCMAILCMLSAYLRISSEAKRTSLTVLCVLAFALLLLSRSATATVALIATLLLIPLFQVLRWRASSIVPAAFLILVAVTSTVFFAIDNSATLLSLLGRGSTMTGRIPLWAVLVKFVSLRPLAGYGYGAFWEGMKGPSASVWEVVKWHPPHAHNMILELLLDIGMVGLILYLLAAVVGFLRAVRIFREGRGSEAALSLMIMSFLLIFNLAENALIGGASEILWVLFIWAITVPYSNAGGALARINVSKVV